MTFIPGIRLQDDPPAPRRTWFAFGRAGLLVRQADATDRPHWALPEETDLVALGVPLDEGEYLGSLDGAAAFAVRVPHGLVVPRGWSMLGLRGLVGAFTEETFAVAGRASHVLDWLTTSRFCGRCGAATERIAAERCMRCPACSLTLYPRIAPAVIVLVRMGDRALLARNAKFPAPFYSTIAGFSDIGETLEETVRREILEEVGLRVGALQYFGSQPWPFPNSLMIGFTAEWESGDIKVDGDEIADAAWFSPTELPLVPPSISIARRMIDAWIREVTTGSASDS